MGKPAAQVNDRMKGAATLYHELLFKNRPVADILEMQPKLVEIWPEGGDRNHLYGRPLSYYQQLQKLNLAAAWTRVKVPTLLIWGKNDQFVDEAMARESLQYCDDGHLEVFETATHWVQHEQPTRVNNLLSQFFA